MRLSKQLWACLFFYEKILSEKKRKSSKNQLTKPKSANKKQQRQQFFAHTKTSKRVKIVLRFGAFLCSKSFRKKNKKA